MTVPVGLDPMLWQQAVEAAAKAMYEHTALQPWADTTFEARMSWRAEADDGLTAAFPVLQQATRTQIADEIAADSAYAKDGQFFGYALGLEQAEVIARTFRVARGETPKEDNDG